MLARRIDRKAFTLVELLVVIAIIGVLVSMLVPAVNAARERGRSADCSNRVKQLIVAMQSYESTHRVYPINWGAATKDGAAMPYKGTMQDRGHSWVTLVLPQLDQRPLYDKIKFGEPLEYPLNAKTKLPNKDNTAAAKTLIPFLRCPSDSAGVDVSMRQALIQGLPVGTTNYKACSGSNWPNHAAMPAFNDVKKARIERNGRNASSDNGWTYPNGFIGVGYTTKVYNSTTPILYSTAPSDITDGASNTIAVGETVPEKTPYAAWYDWRSGSATCGLPPNWNWVWQVNNVNPDKLTPTSTYFERTNGFLSRHSNASNFAMADGSVRSISNSVDWIIFCALGTIDGGEVIESDY